MSLPPGLNPNTADLIRQGKWSCEATSDGWIIRTEPYSWCCNPQGQTSWHFNKAGEIIKTESGEVGRE